MVTTMIYVVDVKVSRSLTSNACRFGPACCPFSHSLIIDQLVPCSIGYRLRSATTAASRHLTDHSNSPVPPRCEPNTSLPVSAHHSSVQARLRRYFVRFICLGAASGGFTTSRLPLDGLKTIGLFDEHQPGGQGERLQPQGRHRRRHRRCKCRPYSILIFSALFCHVCI